MSNGFDIFTKDLDELEKIAYGSMAILNISDLLVPDKEIMKKMLAEKSPELSKEDIDLMADAAYDVDSKVKKSREEDAEDIDEPAEKETKEERKRRREIEKEEKKKAREEKKKNKQERKEDRRDDKEAIRKMKEQRKEKLKEEEKLRKEELKKIFKKRLEDLKREVKELKDKIKSAVFTFLNKFKDVSKAFILALIKVATSIPGAVVMVAAPPWNVPGAISSLLVVIVAYLDLLSKVQSIIPFMNPLRRLPTVLTKKDLNSTGFVFDAITLLLIELYRPIIGLKSIIDKIIVFIKSLFSSGKRRDKIFKQATKRLVKLGHIKSAIPRIVSVVEGTGEEAEGKLKLHSGGIRKTRLTQPDLIKRFAPNGATTGSPFTIPAVDDPDKEVPVTVNAWDGEDVEEILSLLEQFEITNTTKWGGESHVNAYRRKTDDIEKQLKVLENELSDKNEFLKDIDTAEFDQFVYDVILPDGEVIPNISEEGLEYYKSKFDLVYRDILLSEE